MRRSLVAYDERGERASAVDNRLTQRAVCLISDDFHSRSMNHPLYQSLERSQRAPSTEEREQVTQALCLHFASDHIAMESLDQRLAAAYAVQTVGELQYVLSDLPALARETLDAGAAPILAPSNVVPARGVVMAVMGGVVRKGSWLVPRHLKVFAFMGGAELDLRDAKFSPGVTEIDVTVIMGGVEITVPHGVRVEAVGGAFMGGFESSAGDSNALDPAQPVLRVSGLAVMGGVEVSVKRPGKKVLKRFEQAMQAAGRLPAEIARRADEP